MKLVFSTICSVSVAKASLNFFNQSEEVDRFGHFLASHDSLEMINWLMTYFA